MSDRPNRSHPSTMRDKAREWLEAARWPDEPACPHCGSLSVLRLQGKSARPGLIHCNACSGQFTVTTGGVMESSHIPLNKWRLWAFYLFTVPARKAFSAHQLHRQMRNFPYKSAWFMRSPYPGSHGSCGWL